LLARFKAEREALLFRIVAADETWVHHFEPETKRSRTRKIGFGDKPSHFNVCFFMTFK
jgi:hypothetical protein